MRGARITGEGLFSENTTCVHFYGEPEGFFFWFFFCTDDSTSDLNCVYYLRTGGKVRIIFLNS